MKKRIAILLAVVVLSLCAISFAACIYPNYEEVEGLYELTSVTSENNTLTMDMYEYYRVTLFRNGYAAVEEKLKDEDSYEHNDVETVGTFTFKDGIIRVKIDHETAATVHYYEYSDGVLTETVGSVVITLTRVEK